jgi:hypothetical protein
MSPPDDMPLPVEDVFDSMRRPTLEQIEQAIAALVAKGLIMDSGRVDSIRVLDAMTSSGSRRKATNRLSFSDSSW